MTAATIKLFLPYGDPKRLRVVEVSNWSGKSLAAPRTEFEEFLARDELESAGVYLLLGTNADSGLPSAYVGEAEIIRDRLKQHKTKDFWNSIVVFVSKDENLTKAHVRYLEHRLLQEARSIGRYTLENSNESNPKLPESDREDMEVYLSRIRQVLPVLGSDLLSPTGGTNKSVKQQPLLYCKNKGASATGRRTESGFVVYKDSTAVLESRPSAEKQHPFVITLRTRLINEGALRERNGLYVFTKDTEFTSPSSAAAVIHGGGANGLVVWKNESDTSLKDLELS